MLSHHLTIALRTLRRDRGYALLNGVGLALALACCLLVGLFVRAENDVDTFHPDADRLRAVLMNSHFTPESPPSLATPVPLAAALTEDAAVEQAGRLLWEFMRLAAVALVVAVPVSALLAGRWLSTFAFHIDVGPSMFLAAGAVLVVVVLAAVGLQALRAATADPVRSLRSD